MAQRRQHGEVQDIIDRVLDEVRNKPSSHFSDEVYRDEPLLVTGRQMASYFPDEYRAMRRVSRWQEGEGGARGRWLTEAELFYRQGALMAEFEDDFPYSGRFQSSAPTYSTMSNRQLRGYFSWRAAVRRGDVREAPAAFAFVYAYELLCGIGAAGPLDGYRKLDAFRKDALAFAPGLDAYMDTWLLDYVAYHGLDPELVAKNKAMAFDRQLIDLRAACADARAALARTPRPKGMRAGTPPLGEDVEGRLLGALDALSVRPITQSELYRHHAADVAHVTAAVFLRLQEHYDRHRKTPYLADWLGEPVELPHTMFASAVFFDPARHPDATVEINPIRSYSCRSGHWSCRRISGGRSRSSEVAELLSAIRGHMEHALGLRDAGAQGGAGQAPAGAPRTPKYLQSMVEREVEARLAWNEAHAPFSLEVDLSKLSGIRSAAAATRESLLTDEEREEDARAAMAPADRDPVAAEEPATEAGGGATEVASPEPAAMDGLGREPEPDAGDGAGAETTAGGRAADASPQGGILDGSQAALLRALLDGAPIAAEGSLDLLVDAINEALFDMIGDTVIEFDGTSPALVEDYREDVEGLV